MRLYQTVLEAQILKDVIQVLDIHKCYYKRLSTGGVLRNNTRRGKVYLSKNPAAGISDLVVFLRQGMTLWIECKSDKGFLSDLQMEFRDCLKELGHHYFVVRSGIDMEEVLLSAPFL